MVRYIFVYLIIFRFRILNLMHELIRHYFTNHSGYRYQFWNETFKLSACICSTWLELNTMLLLMIIFNVATKTQTNKSVGLFAFIYFGKIVAAEEDVTMWPIYYNVNNLFRSKLFSSYVDEWELEGKILIFVVVVKMLESITTYSKNGWHIKWLKSVDHIHYVYIDRTDLGHILNIEILGQKNSGLWQNRQTISYRAQGVNHVSSDFRIRL